ncbi:hypothetical protein SCP_0704500 [Sparassis crispa]|uniref:Uncharacterized protein n=1 Tax=Sparassis crispa TaxID=139825 RepID=A0A401GSU9_9APHY|nr:hypothetical protein SCP_0704500 [Sparassis crispa]GBE85263.1 hypothetical protein SCP_0704500 [Sparassis crispa]
MFRHPRRTEGKTFVFNAVIDLPGGDEVVVLLRYFNQHNFSFPDGSYYQINANVAKIIPGVNTHYTSAIAEADRLDGEEFDLMGDVIWLTPLEKNPAPMHGPIMYAAGAVADVDKGCSQFNLNTEQFITFARDLASISKTMPSDGVGSVQPRTGHATLTLHATIPDSPRWKKNAKPMPSNGKYVYVQGLLRKVDRETRKDSSNREIEVATMFAFDVENITFMGSVSAKTLPTPAEPVVTVDSPTVNGAPQSARKRLKAVHSHLRRR